jgi:hypothetical protein
VAFKPTPTTSNKGTKNRVTGGYFFLGGISYR